jgi:hypothetical protein
MEYWCRPSWLIFKPQIADCFDDDNIPFGRNVFNTTADLIAQPFNYGKFWKEGKKKQPYVLNITKREYWHQLGYTKDIDKHAAATIEILQRLEENSVFFVEVNEKSLTIEFPDMMKYVDKTNEDNARELFGKGKITKEQMEEIIETGELPSELSKALEDKGKRKVSKEKKSKVSNTKVSKPTQADTSVDDSKESKSTTYDRSKEDKKPIKDLSKLTYNEVCECKIEDIKTLHDNDEYYLSLNPTTRQEVDRRYMNEVDNVPF